MSHVPLTPSLPLTLPTRTLTFPATDHQGLSDIPQHQVPLKVKFQASILAPTPLTSPRVITSRKLEECLDVIVPVGGRVEVDVRVQREHSSAVISTEVDDGDFEMQVQRRLRSAFDKNRQILSLESVYDSSTSYAAATPTSNPASSAKANSPVRPIIVLRPLLANAALAGQIKTIVPSGQPIAYLTRLSVIFAWSGLSTGKAEEESNPLPVGEVEPEDFLDDCLEDTNAMVQDELLDDMDVATTEALHHDSCTARPLPLLMIKQLDAAFARLFRIEFIKRFPLIFDAGLYSYLPILTLPPAITSSINHMIFTASRYDTPLLKSARLILQSIAKEQDRALRNQVNQLANLPTRKKKVKRQTIKKVVAAIKSTNIEARDPIEGTSESQGSTSSSTSGSGQTISLTSQDEEEDRAAEYLTHARLQLEEEDRQMGGDRGKLIRVLSVAIGKMGKFKWLLRRGRLTWSRIPIADCNETTPLSISADHDLLTDLGIINSPVSSSHHPASHTALSLDMGGEDLLSEEEEMLDDLEDSEDDFLDDDNEEWGGLHPYANIHHGQVRDEEEDDFLDDDEDELVSAARLGMDSLAGFRSLCLVQMPERILPQHQYDASNHFHDLPDVLEQGSSVPTIEDDDFLETDVEADHIGHDANFDQSYNIQGDQGFLSDDFIDEDDHELQVLLTPPPQPSHGIGRGIPAESLHLGGSRYSQTDHLLKGSGDEGDRPNHSEQANCKFTFQTVEDVTTNDPFSTMGSGENDDEWLNEVSDQYSCDHKPAAAQISQQGGTINVASSPDTAAPLATRHLPTSINGHSRAFQGEQHYQSCYQHDLSSSHSYTHSYNSENPNDNQDYSEDDF